MVRRPLRHSLALLVGTLALVLLLVLVAGSAGPGGPGMTLRPASASAAPGDARVPAGDAAGLVATRAR